MDPSPLFLNPRALPRVGLLGNDRLTLNGLPQIAAAAPRVPGGRRSREA